MGGEVGLAFHPAAPLEWGLSVPPMCPDTGQLSPSQTGSASDTPKGCSGEDRGPMYFPHKTVCAHVTSLYSRHNYHLSWVLIVRPYLPGIITGVIFLMDGTPCGMVKGV